MTAEPRTLGIMRPMGGGDPIPLLKDEVVIGRRPTCDIQLDFENVSGKHCVLRMVNHVWHVRNLGSTNGTSMNGQRLSGEAGLMPDDELGIATHYFTIDYDPVAPVMTSKMVLEEEMIEKRKHKSLMELAGFETDDRRRRERPVDRVERPSAAETDFDDAIPDRYNAPAPQSAKDDDDFFRIIEDDAKKKK